MGDKIVVKGYKIQGQIDQYGIRSVYKALCIRDGKEVFLTTMPAKSTAEMNNLRRRAQQSSLLRMPGIAVALDSGEAINEIFYYTTEAISTQPILNYLAQISDRAEYTFTCLGLFLKALELLEYIHSAKTTHRDLSTQQLRVTEDGECVIEGFINGRPKQETRNIANMVFLPYISPEQLLGHAADVKTDIYSMGVILYELMTDHLPYTNNHMKMEDYKTGRVQAPSQHRLDLPDEVAGCILKAMASRNTRYASVREFADDIEAIYNKRSLRMKFQTMLRTFRNMLTLKM